MPNVTETTTYQMGYLAGPSGLPIEKQITVSPEQASSVEINTDSKGQAKLTVKVYDCDPDKALEKALELYERGCKTLSAKE